MSDNNQQDSMVMQFSDLFGAPPLLRGEDKDRYCRLYAAVEHDVKPKTIFDWFYVRDITDKLWQQQRCRQSATSLVEGAYIEALASLLRPFYPSTFSMGEDVATTMARDYYSGEAKPKRLEELETRLAVHGISQEQIRAKATQLCGSDISLFSRMESNCEASLRMLKKEHVRRDENENVKVPVSSGPKVVQLQNSKT